MTDTGHPSKITVFGHRGARGIYPENTMAGFRYLRDIGIKAVEVDVQNAANRVPVVAHDPHIMPAFTRDSQGAWVDETALRPILNMPVQDLQKLDVGTLRPGSKYAASFPDQARLSGERIPTFETFCQWACTDPALLINVEIKSHATNAEINDPPHVLAEDITNILIAHGLVGRSIVSSFDWRVVQACADRAPDLRRGFLTLERSHGTSMVPNIIDGSPWMDGVYRRDHDNSLPQTIADLGGAVWCPYFEDLTQADLDVAKKCGLRVNVWTVNAPKDIQNMIDLGVDGIISDFPSRVQNILAAHAVS